MQLLRIHYQKLFLCVLCVSVVVVVVRVWEDDGGVVGGPRGAPRTTDKVLGSVGRGENNINIDSPVLAPLKQNFIKMASGSNVFADLFQEIAKEETCPLCLGHDLCEDVMAGFLTLTSDSPRLSLDGGAVYKAALGGHHMLNVKVPPADVLSRLDRGVCANASLESGCSVATAAPRSFLASHKTLTPSIITHLLQLVRAPRSRYPLLMCPTKRLLAVMERAFDDNSDGSLSTEERLALLTSLAVAPDIVVLKLLSKANLKVGLPRVVGVCGRAGVTEGELTPLTALLDETFNVRASLAAQLLTLVDDFMEEDPDWYLFSEVWLPSGLAVNKDGEVVVTELGGVAVVDKRLFRDEYEDEGEAGGGEVCNRACFRAFHTEVYSQGADPDQACARLEDVGSLMYASVCASVLSDMKQHKFTDYLTSDNPRLPRTNKGLLHSIPASDRPTIEQLLSECVEEVSAGGRLQAAQDLRDYLSDYLMDEDEDEVDQEEDEEEEEEDDEEEEEEGEEGVEKEGGEEEGNNNEGGKDEDYDYGDDS